MDDYWVLDWAHNTPENCYAFCQSKGYRYSGAQFSSACSCGNNVPKLEFKTAESECDMTCTGNELFNCGGYHRMNVYGPGMFMRFT